MSFEAAPDRAGASSLAPSGQSPVPSATMIEWVGLKLAADLFRWLADRLDDAKTREYDIAIFRKTAPSGTRP